jgi:hypothetical protein
MKRFVLFVLVLISSSPVIADSITYNIVASTQGFREWWKPVPIGTVIATLTFSTEPYFGWPADGSAQDEQGALFGWILTAHSDGWYYTSLGLNIPGTLTGWTNGTCGELSDGLVGGIMFSAIVQPSCDDEVFGWYQAFQITRPSGFSSVQDLGLFSSSVNGLPAYGGVQVQPIYFDMAGGTGAIVNEPPAKPSEAGSLTLTAYAAAIGLLVLLLRNKRKQMHA